MPPVHRPPIKTEGYGSGRSGITTEGDIPQRDGVAVAQHGHGHIAAAVDAEDIGAVDAHRVHEISCPSRQAAPQHGVARSGRAAMENGGPGMA